MSLSKEILDLIKDENIKKEVEKYVTATETQIADLTAKNKDLSDTNQIYFKDLISKTKPEKEKEEIEPEIENLTFEY